MKKLLVKPGFEFIFAISIMAIFGLPALVFAQTTRNLEINITNGDTVVNGKNIKDLSPADREQALKDIDNLGNAFHADHQRITIMRRNHSDTGMNREFSERHRFGADSSRRMYSFRYRTPGGKDSMFTFRMNPDKFRFEPRDFEFNERNFDMPGMRGHGFDMMHHRNTQSFEYTNTGSDGIPTHVSFRVNDASPGKTKDVTGSEKADLELKDLTLVPEFSSGKTLLTFNLATHTVADVKLTDNEGKVIWSEKDMNGTFAKSFPLGLNGIYFLQVKQGSKAALKRILKEE
jgi:hypothetical protein